MLLMDLTLKHRFLFGGKILLIDLRKGERASKRVAEAGSLLIREPDTGLHPGPQDLS